MHTLTRRSTVLGLVTLGALGARQLSAAAPKSVRVATPPIDSATSLYVAQSQGYFDRFGIDCEIVEMANGQAISAALLSGDVDVGAINVLSLITAYEKKLPFRIVTLGTLLTAATPVGGMLVRTDSNIQHVTDLDSKIIAVNSLKGIGWISIVNWMDRSGANSKTAQFIEMPFSVMRDALTNRRVDAALLQEPALTIALKSGGTRVVGNAYSSISPRWCYDAWAATQPWISANEDVCNRFADAMLQASIWANAHHDATAAIVSKKMKIDPDITRSMNRDFFVTKPTASLIAPVIDVAAHYDLIASPFPAADLFSSAALRG